MKRKVISLVLAGTLLLGVGACAQAESEKDAQSAQQLAPWDKSQLKTEEKNGVISLVFPKTKPPRDLVVQQLQPGTGKEVKNTDFVVANYTGQVWGKEKHFDSSFDRGNPTGFSLEKVIPGWTKGLAGQKVGAKVALIVPPKLGYGPAGGQSSAGIGKDDVIAFYVEITDAYSKDQAGQPDAQPEADPASLPIEIRGAVGGPISVKVKPKMSDPKEKTTTVLARGTGEPVGEAGTTIYYQVAASNWDNSISETTYGQVGVQSSPVQKTGLFDGLVGIPVGSRVLITLPPMENTEGANKLSSALVVDILGQTKEARKK